eukprot:12930421-Prorocentrum_lima.AAC.1
MMRTTATQALHAFIAEISTLLELSHALRPHIIVSDNGSSFVSVHFREFVGRIGSLQRFSSPYQPQQNPFVERMWGVTFGVARVLLASVVLFGLTLHPFAVQTARWILNRLPTPSRGNLSPYFILTRTPASMQYLRVFGCLCRHRLPPPQRQGDRHLAPRANPAVYLGPSE